MKTFNFDQFGNYSKAYEKYSHNPLAQASLDFILSVVMIIGLFLFAIKPTVITISQLQDKIEAFNTLNKALVTKINTIQNLDVSYQGMQSTISLANQALPDSHNFMLFEQQLRYFTQRDNLTIASLTFSKFPLFGEVQATADTKSKKSKLPSGVEGISFNLTAQGSYKDVKKFISDLEQHIRLAHIDKVDLQTDKQSTDITLKINAVIYFGNKLTD